MKKFISFLLAAVLLVSAVPTALATNDYSQGTQVVYQATGSESYTITVPAQLAPGGNGTVTLQGTWADNRIITVTAEPTVTLTNSIKAEDQKMLNVHFDGISEAGSNTGSQTFTEGVSVDDITNALFGTWSGTFYYNVEMRDIVTKNNTMRGIAHSAYWGSTVPENTLETFRLAKEDGFKYVETDVRFTSDGIPVLLHDETINRTARNIDGSELTETINITDITFDEVRKYDFGYCGYLGYLGKGITIPSFEEFIIFCKENNLHAYLDVDTISEQQVQVLVNIINDNNMQNNIAWTSANPNSFEYIAKYSPGDLCYTVTQITDNCINTAKNIQQQVSNKVYISSRAYSKEDVELVKTAGLPMMVWTINDKNTMANLDPYISAVQSDKYNPETLVYSESEWEVVKELSSSDLKYGYMCAAQNKYGYTDKDYRAAYCNFDIPAEFGYIYKVEFTSTLENVQVSIIACNDNMISLIKEGKAASNADVVNTPYQNSGVEYEVPRMRNGYPMGAIRLTFKDVDEVGASDYITSVTISRKQVQ